MSAPYDTEPLPYDDVRPCMVCLRADCPGHRPPLPMGAKVRLPDGTVALAYRDRGSDTYVTAQVLHGAERRDSGWRRWQLEAL